MSALFTVAHGENRLAIEMQKFFNFLRTAVLIRQCSAHWNGSCAQSRIGTIPNRHYPEWTPSRDPELNTILNVLLHLYSKVTLVFYRYCLVRTLSQDNGLNKH